MAKLTDKDKKLISEAIASAEKNTSGEISVVVAKQSSDYAVYELTFALILGILFTTIALVFFPELDALVKNRFWTQTSALTATIIGLGNFVLIAIFYLLANLPFIDRLIIPKSVKAKMVREKAENSFLVNGVHSTRDRTGVLIFISTLERRVEIIADTGIAAVYSNDSWSKQVARIITGVKDNKFSSELSEVIKTIGKVLTKNFPIKDDDTNELSNEVKEI